jgi:hypothetical protein
MKPTTVLYVLNNSQGSYLSTEVVSLLINTFFSFCFLQVEESKIPVALATLRKHFQILTEGEWTNEEDDSSSVENLGSAEPPSPSPFSLLSRAEKVKSIQQRYPLYLLPVQLYLASIEVRDLPKLAVPLIQLFFYEYAAFPLQITC